MQLVLDDFQSRFSVDQEKKLVQEKTKTAYDRLEESLHSLSLGTKKTIDVETYKIGLERQWQTEKSNGPRKSMKLDEFLGHKALEMEELEWYKRCMKEKFVLPYFQNITGTCFLWVIDCINNALNGSVIESSGEISDR